MPWTDQRILRLIKFHAEGLACSAIAARLGDITKNAVIGKLHRLGLKRRFPVVAKNLRKPKINPLEGSRATGRANAVPEARAPAFALALHSRRHALTPAGAKQKALAQQKYLAAGGAHECDPPMHERIGLLELTRFTCKFPLGNPGEPDFAFCGREKPSSAGPYCPSHTTLACKGSPVINTLGMSVADLA